MQKNAERFRATTSFLPVRYYFRNTSRETVIARSEVPRAAGEQSPSAYCEIATGLRPRNDNYTQVKIFWEFVLVDGFDTGSIPTPQAHNYFESILDRAPPHAQIESIGRSR